MLAVGSTLSPRNALSSARRHASLTAAIARAEEASVREDLHRLRRRSEAELLQSSLQASADMLRSFQQDQAERVTEAHVASELQAGGRLTASRAPLTSQPTCASLTRNGDGGCSSPRGLLASHAVADTGGSMPATREGSAGACPVDREAAPSLVALNSRVLAHHLTGSAMGAGPGAFSSTPPSRGGRALHKGSGSALVGLRSTHGYRVAHSHPPAP